MTDTARKLTALGVAGAALLALSLGLALVLGETQRAPEGPVEIVWDREVCAHCGMHIGEPGFAAQLQTAAGDVLDFDDPGCLIEYLAEQRPDVAAIWLHHLREDRWLAPGEAAFVRVPRSPMGYGLGAVGLDEARAAGEPAPLDFDEARDAVLSAGAGPGGDPLAEGDE